MVLKCPESPPRTYRTIFSLGNMRIIIAPFQLLQKEASKRLGSGSSGSEEIRSHKWFKSVNWKKLEGREIRPSFVPEVAGKQCVANFEDRWTSMPVLDSPASSPKFDDNPFKGFTFIGTPALFLDRHA